MWLTFVGYIASRLFHSVTARPNGRMITRRFSAWLLLGTICMCQFGISAAQKDSGFGDGAKSNNNAFQTSQKGSELGESPSRNGASAGRPVGNVRAVQTQSTANTEGEDSGTAAAPSQNASPPAARPSLGAAGGGLSGVGEERTVNSGVAAENPTRPPVLHGRKQQIATTPSPTDQEGQTENASPQPQAPLSPQVQPQQQGPHAQFPKPPAASKPRGGVSAVIGDESSNVAATTGASVASGEIVETSATPAIADPNTPAPAGTINSAGRAGNSAGASKGKAAKVRPGTSGNSNAGAGLTGGSGSESGDGAIKIGGNSGAVEEVTATSPKPKSASGLVPSVTAEESDSDSAHGPPAATPNAPPLPTTGASANLGAGLANGRVPVDGGPKPVAAGPQLSARSPGAPSPPLPRRHPQAPIDSADQGTTPLPLLPAGATPAAAGGQSAEVGGEDAAASGALIKAVNDEYVEVVKNLTDAGVLTEADYESKPVSDLFAILLEKLINANPGANEEEQRHLVHQAGIEFVEVFRANAAATKNVSEIVRLVSEQLQTATIILNEGHAVPGLESPSPIESSTPVSNPLDATAAVRFGSPGRTGQKGTQATAEISPFSNASVATNRSEQPILGLGSQPTSGTTGSRRPGPAGTQVIGSEATFPGPPGAEGESSQPESTTTSILNGSNDKSSTRHGPGLLPFAGSGAIFGASSPSPVPGPGFQRVSGGTRVGGFNSINGQLTSTHEVDGLNGTTASENGTSLPGSLAEVPTTTQEPTQEGPVLIPIGNPRFPFPAHAPSTLRPPLRFFTTSSAATTSEGDNGPQPPSLGAGGTGFGSVETLSPFVVTAAPPSFVPFGRNPAPSPGGRVIIGGTPGGIVDSSSETSLGSDFPSPPTWDFPSDSTLSPIIIGDGSAGSIELNEGPKIATLTPVETGIFGVAANATTSPPSAILGASGNATQLPLITTTSDEVPAPFTHDIFGSFQSTLSSSSSSLSTLSGLSASVTVSPLGNGTSSNTSDGEFLVFGSGLQSNSHIPTSGPFTANATESGESFVTESAEVNETSSGSGELPPGIRTSSGITPISPVVIPGVQSGILLPNISVNGTNAAFTSTPTPGQGIPGIGFDISTSSSSSSGLETTSSSSISVETTQSSGSAEINETSSLSGNTSTTSGLGGLIIGSETSNATGVSGSTESTISGGGLVTGSSSSTEGLPTIFGNGSSIGTATDYGNGSSPVTVSGLDVSTTEETEVGSGSGSEDSNNGTTDHSGSGGGIFLPTRPIQGNATEVPGGSEGEISTSTSGATSGTSSNPMVIWSFRIVDPNTVWDSELLNKESFQYKELHSSLISDLKTLFKTLEPSRFVDVTIKRFSKGSVIVDGQTELSERVDSSQLLDNFVKLVAEHKNTIGGRSVDPSSITFDRHQYAPQASSGNTVSAGGTPNWVIALVVAVVLLALIIIAIVVVIKRRKRQASRDNYMVDEETMNGGAKSWPPRNANQQTQGQQRSNGLSNGRDQYSGVNMYEMKEPAAPNAHMNYGYQPDRPSNGHGAHGRSVTEIHINETNVDNEATSKH